MKIKLTKKLIIIIILLGIILAGVYFVLGNTGQSGPEAAPNLEEYGLVGHWTFEEGSGQTIYDRSGNGNDGTLGASDSIGKDDPVFAAGHDSSGPGGMGMSFDGVDDYVDLPDGNTYLNVDAGTISMWYKSDGSDYEQLYEYVSLGLSDHVKLYFSWYDSLRIQHLVNSQGNDYMDIDVDDVRYDTDWHFIAATWDVPNDIMSINYDGIHTTSPETLETGTFDPGNSILGDDITPDGGFKGIIDSVRIYNRALSADEIRMLYNQKKPIFHLKMDEGSGTDVYDSSGNEHHGTLHE